MTTRLNETTRISLPATAIITLLVAGVTAGMTFAGVRTQALTDARGLVAESVTALRQEQREALSRYVTREELLSALDQRFDRFEQRLIQRLGGRQ